MRSVHLGSEQPVRQRALGHASHRARRSAAVGAALEVCALHAQADKEWGQTWRATVRASERYWTLVQAAFEPPTNHPALRRLEILLLFCKCEFIWASEGFLPPLGDCVKRGECGDNQPIPFGEKNFPSATTHRLLPRHPTSSR